MTVCLPDSGYLEKLDQTVVYKTPKNGQWVGTVLLNACELIERPSKKDGFCFKLFHPLEQSIWAIKVSGSMYGS